MKYISRFKCKEIRKKYVIPNKNWFTSLNKLDIFTKKKHDLLKLLTNEKILIKITYCRNHDLQDINKLFIGLPNLVQTFYTFFCYDNSATINTVQTFSIADQNNEYVKDCYHVTMELMKFYKNGNLTKYIDRIDQNTTGIILQQLLYCQVNIFSEFMFTHNDIKLTNILVKKYKQKKEFTYEYINKKVISNHEYILSDYDRIIAFGNTYKNGLSKSFNIDEYCYFSLFSNIVQTISILNKTDLIDKNINNIWKY